MTRLSIINELRHRRTNETQSHGLCKLHKLSDAYVCGITESSPFVCDVVFPRTNLFHCLPGAYNRDAAVSRSVLESVVDGSGWRDHGAIRVGQLVQAFLDDQPYQSIGVEFEVTARGVSKIRRNRSHITTR